MTSFAGRLAQFMPEFYRVMRKEPTGQTGKPGRDDLFSGETVEQPGAAGALERLLTATARAVRRVP